jgi:hypothetical protein
MKKLILFLLLVFLFSACKPISSTPNPSLIQTAIAQTEKASPSQTPTQENTPSPIPTETALPTITATQTSTPAPDLRVIDYDPYRYLLVKDDLPKDARYYLPGPGWISPHRNSEVVAGWGVNEGREYLEKTGRVDGWWVWYNRGTQTVIAPEEIYDNVVIYKSIEGAAMVIDQYGNCANPKADYVEIDTDLQIGDHSRACIYREMQSNGDNRVWYNLEFTYRNFYHELVGWGWEKDINPEYIWDVAKTLLAKLEAAPLSDTVTFKP